VGRGGRPAILARDDEAPWEGRLAGRLAPLRLRLRKTYMRIGLQRMQTQLAELLPNRKVRGGCGPSLFWYAVELVIAFLGHRPP